MIILKLGTKAFYIFLGHEVKICHSPMDNKHIYVQQKILNPKQTFCEILLSLKLVFQDLIISLRHPRNKYSNMVPTVKMLDILILFNFISKYVKVRIPESDTNLSTSQVIRLPTCQCCQLMHEYFNLSDAITLKE